MCGIIEDITYANGRELAGVFGIVVHINYPGFWDKCPLIRVECRVEFGTH